MLHPSPIFSSRWGFSFFFFKEKIYFVPFQPCPPHPSPFSCTHLFFLPPTQCSATPLLSSCCRRTAWTQTDAKTKVFNGIDLMVFNRKTSTLLQLYWCHLFHLVGSVWRTPLVLICNIDAEFKSSQLHYSQCQLFLLFCKNMCMYVC